MASKLTELYANAKSKVLDAKSKVLDTKSKQLDDKSKQLDTIQPPKENLFKRNKKKIFVGGAVALFVIFIIVVTTSSKSDTSSNANTDTDKKKIKNKIEDYKKKYNNKIDFTQIDEVKQKIIYYTLKKVEYDSKQNIDKLRFANLIDLNTYEQNLFNNKDQEYAKAYNNSIKTLTDALKWLNPLEKGLGLNPNQRITASTASLVKNISDVDKIIYSYLHKTNQLQDIIKNLLTITDYMTLVQSRTGITGLMAGSLLL